MVYAKLLLKKVDWSTLNDIPNKTIPKTLEILKPDVLIDMIAIASKGEAWKVTHSRRMHRVVGCFELK